MADPRPAFAFDPEWRITLFALVMVPAMIGLGCWQLQRADEKAALAARFEARRAQPPAALSALWQAPAADLVYLPVELSGEYREREYFLLDNSLRGGQFGYEVLALLELAGGDGTVLVNRGWIAGDPARRTLPVVPAVAGRVTVTGQVYVPPGRPYTVGDTAAATGWPRVVPALEMERLGAQAGALTGQRVFPYTLRLDEGAPGALVTGWPVVNVSPEKHRAYAVQWFAMATALSILYLLRSSNLWSWLRAVFSRGPANDRG